MIAEPDETSPADESLMAELAGGDDTALRPLMDRWQVPLRSFLYRFLQDDHEAADVAQETFVRVHRHRARWRPGARFSTWMFHIALNLARDRRRWWRLRRHDDVDTTFGLSSGGDSPDAAAERAERVAEVRAAVAALPGHLRSIIILSEYEHLPQAEIAAIEGITVKAVETRLARAREKLRKVLRH